MKRAAALGNTDAQQALGTTPDPAPPPTAGTPTPKTVKTWLETARATEHPVAPDATRGTQLRALEIIAGAALVLAAICVGALRTFRNRVRALEFQVRSTRAEISSTNQHLGELIGVIEKRALPAPASSSPIKSERPPSVIDGKADFSLRFKAQRKRPHVIVHDVKASAIIEGHGSNSRSPEATPAPPPQIPPPKPLGLHPALGN